MMVRIKYHGTINVFVCFVYRLINDMFGKNSAGAFTIDIEFPYLI